LLLVIAAVVVWRKRRARRRARHEAAIAEARAAGALAAAESMAAESMAGDRGPLTSPSTGGSEREVIDVTDDAMAASAEPDVSTDGGAAHDRANGRPLPGDAPRPTAADAPPP